LLLRGQISGRRELGCRAEMLMAKFPGSCEGGLASPVPLSAGWLPVICVSARKSEHTGRSKSPGRHVGMPGIMAAAAAEADGSCCECQMQTRQTAASRQNAG